MACLKLLSFLSFTFLTACWDWKGTQPFYKSSDPNKKTITHINIDTAIVHNFAALSDKIVHRTYRTKFGVPRTICEARNVTSLAATHTKHTAALSDSQDQIIVLVFAAPRSLKNDAECVGNLREGCSEIFVVESIDEGRTWSGPVTVNRTRQDDLYHRMSPSVAYDRETSTIYIAYTRVEVVTGKSVIGFIKKIVGGNYTEEQQMHLGYSYNWGSPKLTVTNPAKHTGHIHLCVTGTSSDGGVKAVLYSRSASSGTGWSRPKDLAPYDHNHHHENAITAVGIAGEEEVFVGFTAFGSVAMVSRSWDGGRSWSPAARVSKKLGKLATLKACGQVKTLGVLASLIPTSDPSSIELVYYNTTTQRWNTLPRPFKSVGQLAAAAAFDCTGLLAHKVAVTAVADQGSAAVFDSCNYDYPEVE